MVRSAYTPRVDDDDDDGRGSDVCYGPARERLVSNIAGHLLDGVSDRVLERAIEHLKNVDENLGDRVESAVGSTVSAS